MGVSRRAGDLIMGLIAMIIYLISAKRDGSMDPLHERTWSQVPRSNHDALERFNLEGVTTVYAVCLSCHFTHAPNKSGSQSYPERCTNRPKPEGEICNTPLLQKNPEGCERPIKTFIYHSFADYLAGLLSVHKAVMDQTCNNCAESLQHPAPTIMYDVFDAEFIRTFQGPEGNMFVQWPADKG